MIANDAAGEGVNLQRGAHLMVNYDLPWNPNRIEQRFGRIHRIVKPKSVTSGTCVQPTLAKARCIAAFLRNWKRRARRSAARSMTFWRTVRRPRSARSSGRCDPLWRSAGEEGRTLRKVDGAVDVDAIEKLVAERS